MEIREAAIEDALAACKFGTSSSYPMSTALVC
jgi:hypothetical protein